MFTNFYIFEICWVKGFSKMYNLLYLAQFGIFCITRFCKKYLDFGKFAQGFSKAIKCYRFVLENREGKGVNLTTPPPLYFGKPDVIQSEKD